MKMTKSNDDIKTIVCPACGKTTEVTRVYSIPVNESPILLHDDVGEVYQCGHADCMAYLLKVRDKFEHVSKLVLLRRQKEISDLLTAEAEVARARLVPAVVETARAMAEAGRLLSSTLYTLTAGSIFRRAYTVEEIIEACAALGFNPSVVDNDTIPHVVAWLEENKGT